VVLGCTHYPFVIPLIKEIVGPEVRVIDPAPAVARQVAHLLQEHGWLASGPATDEVLLLTTGEAAALQQLLPALLPEKLPVAHISWHGDQLKA